MHIYIIYGIPTDYEKVKRVSDSMDCEKYEGTVEVSLTNVGDTVGVSFYFHFSYSSFAISLMSSCCFNSKWYDILWSARLQFYHKHSELQSGNGRENDKKKKGGKKKGVKKGAFNIYRFFSSAFSPFPWELV
ncbi:uncharacterized protein TEOVI_000749800 [Trypanosoma equiperdum]|uniref:Uncharacterized protein n=1 Tax=Trypanosoma equiperdum TaxID=5694 RepID=A0A1G4I6S7_TRYEQ|nr:hypothetical protein, conserved [Trypanosoma equiperdum]